jgi:hypothetical protein
MDVVARRAFALPDEAISLLMGDCFVGKNAPRSDIIKYNQDIISQIDSA